jgi:ribose-phosphate pyrophosphokinase
MPEATPVVFGLRDSSAYAERVAARLGLPLAAHEEREFEDSEHKSRPLVEVRNRHCAVIHVLNGDAGHSADDKLCRLLFFCATLKDCGARRVTAVVPYLCYSRKDRRTQPHDPITSRYVAAMFESCGVDAVITLDVHNVAAFENAFRIPTVNLSSASLFAAHFAACCAGREMVAVSPDAGGTKRVELFRRELERLTGRDVNSAYLEKHRARGVVTGQLLAGDVKDKVAVILDDLISTGGTLRRAARACRAAGAAQVHAAAAHGLFVTGCKELLHDPDLAQITITDTVPPIGLDAELAAQRLRILDSTALVAAAIANDAAVAPAPEAG